MASTCKPNVSSPGFSLIELSIGLIVIGLLMGGFLQAYQVYTKSSTRDETETKVLSSLPTALSTFYSDNGRFPCPASMTLDPYADEAGKEQCADALTAATNLPTTADCENGVCAMADLDTSGGAVGDGPDGTNDTVYSGAVPYADLKIPYEEALDGWGRKVQYVVTARMTDPATFDREKGAIGVVNEVGASVVDSTGTYPGALAVFVSHGPNGRGAYSADGVLVEACGSTAEGLESENCDNDAVFSFPFSGALSEGAGSEFNDDFVRYILAGKTGMWSYSPDNVDNIFSTNPRNVGIGTNDPQYRLDVDGNIKVDSVWAESLCTAEDTDCFNADVIGGDGMSCEVNVPMTGIKNADTLCGAAVFSGATPTLNCPTGQYLYGIAADGTALCRFFPE